MKKFMLKEMKSKRAGTSRYNFEARLGKRFHKNQRQTTFKGVIIENHNLGVTTVYRNRNTNGNAMYQNMPSGEFNNTRAGQEIYKRFVNSSR